MLRKEQWDGFLKDVASGLSITDAACEYFIEGFESRQPEIDELRNEIEMVRTLMARTLEDGGPQ